MTVPALCANSKKDKQVHEDKRQVAALPLYAGLAVSPWVWAALVAAYGVAKLVQYGITEGCILLMKYASIQNSRLQTRSP
jgi:hypothetical protein